MRVDLMGFGARQRTKGLSAAQAAGVRYERKVSHWLQMQHRFLPQPVFLSGGFICVPDGLLFAPTERCVCVVEIKSQLSELAWPQLYRYMSIVRDWYCGAVHGVVICENYLRGMRLRGNPYVLSDISEVFDPLCAARLTILPLGIRRLPKGDYNGRGAGDWGSDVAVRSDGGCRDGAGCSVRTTLLAP